jgi:hypothetical protein
LVDLGNVVSLSSESFDVISEKLIFPVNSLGYLVASLDSHGGGSLLVDGVSSLVLFLDIIIGYKETHKVGKFDEIDLVKSTFEGNVLFDHFIQFDLSQLTLKNGVELIRV